MDRRAGSVGHDPEQTSTFDAVECKGLRANFSGGDEVNESWNWDGVEDHVALYKAMAEYLLLHPDGIRVIDPTLFRK